MSGWSPSEKERERAKAAKRQREEREALFGTIIATQPMTPDEVADLRRRWAERYGPINGTVGPELYPSQRCAGFIAIAIITAILLGVVLFSVYVWYFL